TAAVRSYEARKHPQGSTARLLRRHTASSLLSGGTMVAVPPAPSTVIARLLSGCALLALLVTPLKASAQTSPPQPQRPTATAADDALQLVPGEPDFTLGALPTTLRMPSGKFGFRITHRFSLPIDSGTAGDFFKNFFNFDSSAQVGIEVRYGLARATQMTFYRT